jgi:mannan endo-1,4-beta-mannosidase
MAEFVPQIDWTRFRRRNLNAELQARHFHAFGCGDEHQALLWLVRRNSIGEDGCLRRDAVPVEARLSVPGLADGSYRVRGWDTELGRQVEEFTAEAKGGSLQLISAPIPTDRAFAIIRA